MRERERVDVEGMGREYCGWMKTTLVKGLINLICLFCLSTFGMEKKYLKFCGPCFLILATISLQKAENLWNIVFIFKLTLIGNQYFDIRFTPDTSRRERLHCSGDMINCYIRIVMMTSHLYPFNTIKLFEDLHSNKE